MNCEQVGKLFFCLFCIRECSVSAPPDHSSLAFIVLLRDSTVLSPLPIYLSVYVVISLHSTAACPVSVSPREQAHLDLSVVCLELIWLQFVS